MAPRRRLELPPPEAASLPSTPRVRQRGEASSSVFLTHASLINIPFLSTEQRRMEWNPGLGSILQYLQPIPASYLYLRYIFSHLLLMVSVSEVSKDIEDTTPHVYVS